MKKMSVKYTKHFRIMIILFPVFLTTSAIATYRRRSGVVQDGALAKKNTRYNSFSFLKIYQNK